MGLFSDKPKYIKAYESIKHIYSIINSNSDGNIEVYFIKYENIHEFHKILKDNDIFDLIPNISKRDEVKDKDKKISDAFSDYKKEKNIEVIKGPKLIDGKYSMKIRNDTKEIKENDDFGNINFIMVENGFIYNMDIQDKDKVQKNQDKYKVKISVINKEIQIDQEPDKNDNIIIIKEKEHNKGVYNFELKQCKEDFNGDSSVEGDEEVEEPKKEEENILNNIVDNTTNTNDTNNNNVPIAKLSDIVKLISSSILNKSEVEIESIIDIYMKANSGKINNELEKKEETINNIITAVNSIKDYYKNQIQNVENTHAIKIRGDEYYENDRNDESLNLIGESKIDIGNLIDDTSNDNNNGIQNLNQNCFEFSLFKMGQCSNSLCKEKIKYDGKNKLNKYPIILNNDIRSIDEIFLTKEKCQFCNQNNSMICTYKFISIPNILILKFDIQKNNPQKYFKVDVENDIDLKKYINANNINNTKYTLLKTLYAFKSDNDNKLYENIQNSDENKYIPYLVFYKQES